MVKKLVKEKLIDYVALDYKANKAKFNGITNCKLWEKFQETLDYLVSIKDSFAFEVLTTWHSDLLSQDDIQEIIDDLNSKGYENNFYLQKCNTVDNSLAFAVLPQSKPISAVNLLGKRIKVEIR